MRRSPNDADETQAAPKPARREFTVYRNEASEIVCREATRDEIKQRENIDLSKLGLRQINHPEFDKSAGAQAPEATGLVIILRATQQLQQNATATAAFNRAAQNWENVIMSPITIYIDVDFGTSAFGQPFPSGVLGATSTPGSSYAYQSVRTNLVAEAGGEGNATKQAIFNSLPANTVPTDLGDASGISVSDSIARAIGLLPATAPSTDSAARIAFNSNFTFDFDPSDGITSNAIDFDAVATHEIGHALGFTSDSGLNIPKPSVWDLYRFRTGTTTGTFPTAQRVLTIGGSPDPLQFDFIPGNAELGLSTGGSTGSTTNGGDGWQSSHWKHVSTCGGYIGIMDPAISNGCRRTITANDTLALTSFGYNLTNNNAPPPPPPPSTPPANDNFGNAQVLTGCGGSVTGSTFGATSEGGEPSHDPTDSSSLSPSHTIWYQWQAPSSGSTTITTNGSDFDTILAVYTGTTVNSLARIVFNDDENSGLATSRVTFSATSNTLYWIAVDGWGGDTGTVKLNWNGCGGTPTPTPTPTPCRTVLTVNDNGDGVDITPGNGSCATANSTCTLRAAIQEANATQGCGMVTVSLAAIRGTVVLNTALPDMSHDVNIIGPGPNQLTVMRSTAAGTATFRIFTIPQFTTAIISGLTISNGNLVANESGGGISNRGTLTLTDCNLYGNNHVDGGGGGLFSIGPLTLNNCNIGGMQPGQGNGANNGVGAGILQYGPITMNGGSIRGNLGTGFQSVQSSTTLMNVEISNNQSVGVVVGGVVTMVNCLIANNSGLGFGGGIDVEGGGLTAINTTISGNTSTGSGGGIRQVNNGIVNLVNVTIANNHSDSDNHGADLGGGINNSFGTMTLRNSIVAGNFSGVGSSGTADDINGAIAGVSSFNLIGIGGSGGLTNGTNANQVGVVDPKLGGLFSNGGPTMTHALLVGSPAINAGSNALAIDQNGNTLTTDQRGVGFSRIINGTVDIGAFESPATPINPIDQPDFFVKQQYLDFLNRQPDQSGWDFWTQQITSCGNDAACIEVKRVNTSGAFFISIEFQQTGNLVYKMYKAGLGNLPSKPVAVDRAPFIADTRQIQTTPAQVIVNQGNWQAQLETNKQAFALAFVQRAAFQTAHASQDAATYVSALFANTGASPTAAETSTAIAAFNNAGGGDAARAAALRSVAESTSVDAKLKNEAFVLMQYFGYLQRNPYDPPEATLDYSGFNFWLGKLNQFNGDFIAAEMVKAFISSSEYRQRFGP
ncbi:MAG TPA: NF038122 family metalloprotease [Pyrinomonadaceae bacterium]|nr:NF038122 family metalloprotease [Pyrinomonadaceae bacterium]